MDVDRRYTGLTKLGFGVLACSSALAVYKSWGDAGSVAFVVLVLVAALVLLFACLREFERRRCRASGGSGRMKAAVWALTTLLTAMFAYASRVAPLLMPLVVGALVSLCLCEYEWARIGLGGRLYAELVKLGFGVAACNSVLAHHHAHTGSGSSAFVFIAFAGLVTRAWLFLRRFDGRARGAEQ